MRKILLLLALATNAHAALDLRTRAEITHWKQTGRADESARLCHDFARGYPERVKCLSMGRTPEGRELLYMLVNDGKSRPTVWVQAGIHAGEIDGKDAVFWLLREILAQKITPDPLAGLRLVFIPILNLDGHERFGKWNRPNQVGPEEMGWRTTAQNYNLNRDFMKADAPEMRALLKLWNQMDPVLSLDLHVTDGAQFQPEVGVITHPNTETGSDALHQAGRVYESELMTRLRDRGHQAVPYYPSFEKEDQPSSGVSRGLAPPRFAHGYFSLRNRIGVLVESHSWKDYATRVLIHRDVVLSSLQIAQKHAAEWERSAHELDRQPIAGRALDLAFKHTDKAETIEFPGYHFETGKSELSGESVIRYFPERPEIWKMPFFEELVPSLTVRAPKEGYFIPAAQFEQVQARLDAHGVKYQRWTGAPAGPFEVFRASKTKFGEGSFEGHQTLAVEGDWASAPVSLTGATWFVPIDQPKGRLVVSLLEPRSSDSFLAWGFYNRQFEQKEYMENYVTEEIGRRMLKEKPAIREEFERKLKEDPEFAKSPDRRFQFFHRHHASWDDQFNRYPILKR